MPKADSLAAEEGVGVNHKLLQWPWCFIYVTPAIFLQRKYIGLPSDQDEQYINIVTKFEAPSSRWGGVRRGGHLGEQSCWVGAALSSGWGSIGVLFRLTGKLSKWFVTPLVPHEKCLDKRWFLWGNNGSGNMMMALYLDYWDGWVAEQRAG